MSTSPGENEKSLLEDSAPAEYVGYVTSTYSKKKQVLATICATLGCLLNGAAIGFTGGFFKQFVSNYFLQYKEL